jgi:translation initiation factor eIF-2B subunit gamma
MSTATAIPTARTPEQLLCQAYVLPVDSVFCRRANTSTLFLDVNMEVAGSLSAFAPKEPLVKKAFIDPSATVSAQTQVGDKCLVGAGSVIGDKCSIKRSIVGRHCKIGNRVSLANSVIFDHAVIEDKYVAVDGVLLDLGS